MLKFSYRCGYDYVKLRKDLPQVHRFLFDSARKRMSTIVQLTNGTKRIHIKGASEIVLDTCTHYLDASGQKKPIDDQMKNLLGDTIK
jgi:magnesium-transporting ATPase (P-type)